MDKDSFVVYIKTEDICADIALGVEARFDTSNYELDRPLPKGENKKIIGLMIDELGVKIITEFALLRPKTYSYTADNTDETKQQKTQKVCHNKKT